jgi:hypothetical protein
MDALLVLDESQSGLSKDLAEAVESQQLSSRTVQTYQHWIAQYLAFYDLTSPVKLTEKNVRDFLSHIVRSLAPSRARLNQAKEALIFFYAKVLHRPLRQAELEFKGS